ncbi:hypothetical protein [Natronobacterium gregoryi]|uniref:Aminopeptidase n=1 Tax=Natronobacterium gregoryi (strain ATCC 43098 / DSM 3393 / CCM 3738 / CIP 104747 / IAM 13177 / JCM 8860 / NBRC 102187 / NCIMB 2189 / SP2) TaxID=797304 RepID=L9YB38_NATGS|nr:hypothetical protein [Natronobacterium gregoryi]ELY70118.1 aminopeptidase [Natronobacterium gregoryi SP2]
MREGERREPDAEKVRSDSFIEADGEVVQRDGTFVFEDGFEA